LSRLDLLVPSPAAGGLASRMDTLGKPVAFTVIALAIGLLAIPFADETRGEFYQIGAEHYSSLIFAAYFCAHKRRRKRALLKNRSTVST
jgi:hypothetical protein